VIDGWWNADYAKEVCRGVGIWWKENKALIIQIGCEKVNSCPEIMPQVEACVLDPVRAVRDFELKLTTQLATDPQCAGIRVISFTSPGQNPPGAGR
jgi:hypothetical protein